MATEVQPVTFSISTTCLNELTGACDKAVPDPNAKGQMNVTLSRACAEAIWNALITALKGPAPAAKKKTGKVSTSVRQKGGRPTGSSGRSGKGS